MRVCDAAFAVLNETDNHAVMWGDEGLLHMIADRAGLDNRDDRPWKRSVRVLNALSRQPGSLIPLRTRIGNGRLVRIFRLPESGT